MGAATGTNQYHFTTHWRVVSTCEEIFDILGNGPDLVRWWPSVYLDVRETAPGDKNGVGRKIELFTKGWLPYTLRWTATATEVEYPHRLVLRADGDFVGQGIWTLAQDGPHVNLTYDWRIEAEKPLLRDLSFLMKPIFEMNHNWAMRMGLISLERELARRHATPEALVLVPAPPGPTFRGAETLWLGLGLAGLGLLLLRGRRRR